MKISTKKISLEEEGFNMKDGSDMIIRILESHIKSHKMQHLIEWERDHSVSPKAKDPKVEKLKAAKEALSYFFNEIGYQDGEVSFKLNLEVKVTSNTESEVQEEKLLVSYN